MDDTESTDIRVETVEVIDVVTEEGMEGTSFQEDPVAENGASEQQESGMELEEDCEDDAFSEELSDMVDVDEGNSHDTIPMLCEDGGEPPKEEDLTADGPEEPTEAKKEGEESKDEPEVLTDTNEGEGTNEAAEGSGMVFPHCHICGFDLPTILTRSNYKKKGQKNRVLFRNKCSRKKCSRFFGPYYARDRTTGAFYVADEADSTKVIRPYLNAPREEKFDATEYERARPAKPLPALPRIPSVSAFANTDGTSTPTVSPKPSAKRSQLSSSADFSDGPSSSIHGMTRAPPPKKQKLKKGYKWEEVKDVTIHSQGMERIVYVEKEAPRVPTMTVSCQTGDDDETRRLVIEEIKSKAMYEGLRPDDTIPLSTSITKRLFLAQNMIAQQGKQLVEARTARDRLSKALELSRQIFKTLKENMGDELRRLRDDIECSKKEIKVFADDLQNEAIKDIRVIKGIKEKVANRIDDTDRFRRKIQASVTYQENLTIAAEEQMNHFHRLTVEMERKVILAKERMEDAETKLHDKIYLANNARCTHCAVNEKMKKMLTEQVAEKTMSADRLGKERSDLARKYENSERVNAIVMKENQKLKFEIRAWESQCYKQKEQLKNANSNMPILAPSLGEVATTPASSTRDDRASDDNATRDMDLDEEKVAQPSEDDPEKEDEGKEDGEKRKTPSPATLSKLPPPPPQPKLSPQEEAHPSFSNWIPKAKKPQEPPEYIAAMQKVEQRLKEGRKEEKKDKGRSQSHSSSSSSHRNGDATKKQPFDPAKAKKEREKEKRKEEYASSRPGTSSAKSSPMPSKTTLSSSSSKPHPSHPLSTKQPPSSSKQNPPQTVKRTPEQPPKKKEEPRRIEVLNSNDPMPSTAHEPAYPVLHPTPKPKVVPYNGPVAGHVTSPSSRNFFPRSERKPIPNLLPAAGMIVPPELRDRIAPSHWDDRPPPQRLPPPRPDPIYDPRPPPFEDFDTDLPWNNGRPAAPVHYGRPPTPIMEWDPRPLPYDTGPPPLRHDYYDRERDFIPPPHREFGLPPIDYGPPHHGDYGRGPPPTAHILPAGPPRPHPDDYRRGDWNDQPWNDEWNRRSYWDP